MLLLCCVLAGSPAYSQVLRDVTETVYLTDAPESGERSVALSVPMSTPRQLVESVTTTPVPTSVVRNGRHYQWRNPSTDSIRLTFRIRLNPLPEWGAEPPGTDTLSWTNTMRLDPPETYILPTLPREALARTRLGDRASGGTPTETVNELLDRLRRVRPVRDPERFNYEQPVLEDFFRRQTTDRRLHLLLSMALQYHDIPHRLVAGKIMRFETVVENQLWVEVSIGDRWSRLHLSESDEWVRENSVYVTCSYDFRDYTFEVMGGGKVDWDSRYQETLLSLWEKKDTALRRKDYDSALAHLDSMLTYYPDLLVVVAEKGLVLVEAGQEVEGMKLLQYALNKAETDNDKASAYTQMAKYYAMSGKPEQAMAALTRSNTYAPVNIEVVYSDYRFKSLREDPQLAKKLGNLYFRE